MKSKIMKTISLSMVLMLMLITITIPVMALSIPDPNYDAAGTGGIKNAGSNIAGIVATIGVAVAVVILITLAIKYITAAPSDKADIKKSAVAYVIGAVLLFAASGVLALIQSFATEIEGSLQEGASTEIVSRG